VTGEGGEVRKVGSLIIPECHEDRCNLKLPAIDGLVRFCTCAFPLASVLADMVDRYRAALEAIAAVENERLEWPYAAMKTIKLARFALSPDGNGR
jgi:hypothetical protein